MNRRVDMTEKYKSRGNYEKKLMSMLQRGELVQKPGQVNHVEVRHDSWCGALRGKRCTCEPDVSLRELRS
jgi:hypothetical protein